MSKDTKNALNAYNLAVLGALDDFYDAYCAIQELYDVHYNARWGSNQNIPSNFVNIMNRLCRKEAEKICIPLIDKYLHFFTNTPNDIVITGSAFRGFSFLTTEVQTLKSITFQLITFSSFITQIQIVATQAIYNHVKKTMPKLDYRYIHDEVAVQIEKNIIEKSSALLFHSPKRISASNEVLYIFQTLSSTSCYKNDHPVVPSRFVADFADGSGQIMLPVHFCYHCQKYFIGTITLSLFEKRFGKFIVQKRRYEEAENAFDNYRLESKLHELGYNVIDGEMNDTERQNLLIYLLEHERISYLEMSSTIEQNITLFRNSYRHQLAVLKWERDLKFIGEYVMKKKEKLIDS